MDCTGCGSLKAADPKDLVRKDEMPELKKRGRVVTVQRTTTTQGQIIIKFQIRWLSDHILYSMWMKLVSWLVKGLSRLHLHGCTGQPTFP
jgi:hypothetical protein